MDISFYGHHHFGDGAHTGIITLIPMKEIAFGTKDTRFNSGYFNGFDLLNTKVNKIDITNLQTLLPQVDIVNFASGVNKLGSQNYPFDTLYINEISGVNHRGHVFSYDTTSQTVTSAGVWRDITFNTTKTIDSWFHISGTANFTCNLNGAYWVSYTATLNRVSTPAVTIELRALLDGQEVLGSQIVDRYINNLIPETTSNSFITNINKGQVFKLQITADTNAGQITSYGNYATIRPSIRLSMCKL